ncbi:MAG: hypothetical protein H7839_22755 [Magnetococcus sp. YQC-5]
MKRYFAVLVCGWVLMASLSTSAAPSAKSDAVEYRHGTLSVTFRGTPIRSVLEQVASKAGIQFLLDSEIQSTVSMQFDKLPLETALRRLLQSHSHALVHSKNKDGSYRISQVKVFKKGQLAIARGERIGSDTYKDGHESATDAAKSDAAKANAFKPGSVKTGQDVAVTDGSGGVDVGAKSGGAEAEPNARIDVHGVRGPAQVMAAIVETRANIDMIERKSIGESQALQSELARTQALLAAGRGGDARELVQKIKTLEQQKSRSEQNNQQMKMAEEVKLNQYQQDLVNLKSPAQQQIEAKAIMNQQAAVMHDQVSQIEVMRQQENLRQASIIAAQKSAAAARSEAMRRQSALKP